MRAVWSFWSKPYFSKQGCAWLSHYHFLLSWVLSVHTAGRHYQDTALVTDTAGADLLVDRLGLPFKEVTTELDALSDEDPEWWALGKLYAYRKQTGPFVHIDSDVFLWNGLPEHLLGSPVFAQSPEYFDATGDSWYPVYEIEKHLLDRNGWLPDEWKWYTANSRFFEAACCGIVGGSRTDILSTWAQKGIDIATSKANRNIWRESKYDKGPLNVLIEQFLLIAILKAYSSDSPSSGVDISYLFANEFDPFESEKAAAAGYTHLIAGAKSNQLILNDLENCVRHLYPALSSRCLQIASTL